MQMQQQSLLEVIAVLFAILYVVLAARQHLFCWPAAIISTALYVYIFWGVTLPFQAVLNGYYLLIAVYGWWHWKQLARQNEAPVKTWSVGKHTGAIVLMAVLSFVVPMLVNHWIDSEYLFLDGTIAIYSCLATYLMTKKVIENWLYWIVLNIAAAYLYFTQALYLTALLYCFYGGYAIIGWLSWKKSNRDWQVAMSKEI